MPITDHSRKSFERRIYNKTESLLYYHSPTGTIKSLPSESGMDPRKHINTSVIVFLTPVVTKCFPLGERLDRKEESSVIGKCLLSVCHNHTLSPFVMSSRTLQVLTKLLNNEQTSKQTSNSSPYSSIEFQREIFSSHKTLKIPNQQNIFKIFPLFSLSIDYQ